MRTAVILSGCGVRDGSEIHEAVTLLLSLDQAGHEVSIFAPNKQQNAVVDHKTGRPMAETRNILVESARIARGQISPLSQLDETKFDAIVLPGGFGAATNLSNFANQGASCTVDAELEGVLRRAHKAGKILGFMCIAPVIAARLFGAEGVKMTIGNDPGTASACEQMGAKHEVCRSSEASIDRDLRIVTTPAYMTARSISECYESARALVRGIESL